MKDAQTVPGCSEPLSGSNGRINIHHLAAFLELADEDAERLRAHAPEFEQWAESFVEVFYAHLLEFDETAGFLKDPERVARLKQLQREHFQSLLQARWDEHYARQRHQVGQSHADVGLEPHLFMGAYNQFLQYFLGQLAKQPDQTVSAFSESTLSLIKAVFLDIGLTLDAYFDRSTREMRQALDMYWDANNDLRRFAQLASHDLKTPIATVANLCDEALDEFGAVLPAEAQRLITAARDQAYKNSAVIDDLLESALASHQRETREKVSSRAILEEVLDRLKHSIKEKQIDVILPDTLPMVLGNPARLREAFFNLLSNAAKFIEKVPGRIEIKVENHEVRHIFSIEDNGPGIPQGELQRIFVPFRRLAEHRDKPGSGLGLYFTLHLIERDGGQVWAESDAGDGSRFCVALRAAEETDAN